MDRRQKKTRKAIFSAFSQLLAEKPYSRITVQEIIDTADIGRTTFYAHFETKDDLLKALCEELFDHILNSASNHSEQGLYSLQTAPESIFCHLLQHLKTNRPLIELLSGENNALFLRCFKSGLAELIRQRFESQLQLTYPKIPTDFLIHHLSGSFVEMVLWWIHGGLKQSAEELNHYFQIICKPLL